MQALYEVALRLPYGDPDPARYGEVLRRLIDDPAAALAAIPPTDFTLVYALGDTLQCALLAASDAEAEGMDRAFATLLDGPRPPLIGVIAYALGRRPAPPATMQKLRAALRASPQCSFRALAMDSAPESEARAALSSPCWRLQAAAYARLQALGVARPADRARAPYLLDAGSAG